MNDPLNTLRSTHSASIDPLNLEKNMRTIHDRIGDSGPNGAVRRRRIGIAAGVSGLACTGLAFALVLAVGPFTTTPSGSAPAIRDGIAGESSSHSALQVRNAAWYADQAVTAIESSENIVQIDSTEGGTRADGVSFEFLSREYLASDGTGMRYLGIDADGNFDGGEERKYPNPDGSSTYFYVDTNLGEYTEAIVPAIPEEPLQTYIRNRVLEMRELIEPIRQLDDDPSLTVSGPLERNIEGRPATCFEYTADKAFGPDAAKMNDSLVWKLESMTATYCFDTTTNLPLLIESTRTGQGGILEEFEYDAAGNVMNEPQVIEWRPASAHSSTTITWHANDEAGRALVHPGVDGLKKLSEEEFNRPEASTE